jgi:hypothetical protein
MLTCDLISRLGNTEYIRQLPALLHEPRKVIGDQVCRKETDRQTFAKRGVRYRINLHATTKPLSR